MPNKHLTSYMNQLHIFKIWCSYLTEILHLLFCMQLNCGILQLSEQKSVDDKKNANDAAGKTIKCKILCKGPFVNYVSNFWLFLTNQVPLLTKVSIWGTYHPISKIWKLKLYMKKNGKLKQKRFKKIAFVQSHHPHLEWKFKLLAEKFSWDVKSKHC